MCPRAAPGVSQPSSSGTASSSSSGSGGRDVPTKAPDTSGDSGLAAQMHWENGTAFLALFLGTAGNTALVGLLLNAFGRFILFFGCKNEGVP